MTDRVRVARMIHAEIGALDEPEMVPQESWWLRVVLRILRLQDGEVGIA